MNAGDLIKNLSDLDPEGQVVICLDLCIDSVSMHSIQGVEDGQIVVYEAQRVLGGPRWLRQVLLGNQTGPECPICGRDLRWIDSDSGSGAASRPTVENCPICLVTEEEARTTGAE